MEDGIERSMSSLVTELEKKQRIVLMPKYEEQVHPIGLSLTGVYNTTPIGRQTTPIGHDNTSISRETTPTGHDTTPIGRQEACPNTCRQETIDKTLGTTPIQNLQETPSTNTGSDS
jgi:hypothetical protein